MHIRTHYKLPFIFGISFLLYLSTTWIGAEEIFLSWGSAATSATTETSSTVTTSASNSDLDCGPQSVIGAAARLGIYINHDQFISQCPMTKNGTTMLDLKNTAMGFGLVAEGIKLTWSELLTMNTPVVLYVSGNHFLFVDPREKSEKNRNQIRLYDYPKSAKWVNQSQLESIWHGEALLLYISESKKNQTVFDSLLDDFGASYAHQLVEHIFTFINKGSEPLSIMSIEKSCGCTEAVANKNYFLPGEKGTIKVSLDLKGRQGLQRQVIKVLTSNSMQPEIALTMQGMAINPVHLSSDCVDFGEVLAGQEAQKELVLTNRADQPLNLGSYEFVLEQDVAGQTKPKIDLTWSKWEKAQDEEAAQEDHPSPFVTLIRGRGDQRLKLQFKAQIPVNTVAGIHQGHITLVTDDPNNHEIKIPVVYIVKPSIQASTNKIRFDILSDQQEVSTSLTLARPDGLPLGQLEVNVEGADIPRAMQMKPRISYPSPDKAEITFTLTPSLAALPALNQGLHHGSVQVISNGQPVMSIPWLCLVRQTKDKEKAS